MKSTTLYGLAVVACIGIALAAFLFAPSAEAPEPARDLSLSHATVNRLYDAAIAPDTEIKQGALQSWTLTLTTPDGKPVEGATVTISGGMPDHGHGLPTAPEVTAYLGDGRYRVEGVKFSMTGWWELRFAIAGPAGADEAVFNVVL